MGEQKTRNLEEKMFKKKYEKADNLRNMCGAVGTIGMFLMFPISLIIMPQYFSEIRDIVPYIGGGCLECLE